VVPSLLKPQKVPQKMVLADGTVAHPHFPWFKAQTGYRDSSMSHQYAAPEIGATESDEEPELCAI
jgi:hypothetical protein